MTTKTNDEWIEEFEARYVTKAGCIHALACTKEGTQGVKYWLRTTLTTRDQAAKEECERRLREEYVENVARAIYDQFFYTEDGTKPEWIKNGNGLMQDKARSIAIKALTPEPTNNNNQL